MIVSTFSCNLEVHRCIQFLQMLQVHINVHFLITIKNMVFQLAFMSVIHIKFQVIDSLLSQGSGLQNFHLVINTIGV